jgi:hypothetical protein
MLPLDARLIGPRPRDPAAAHCDSLSTGPVTEANYRRRAFKKNRRLIPHSTLHENCTSKRCDIRERINCNQA